MIKYLTIEDFDNVDVAEHCDYRKLNIAIEEALLFDLKDILGVNYGYFYNLIANKQDYTFIEEEILNGKTYNCGSYTKIFLGLKRMLVYYTYARYVFEVHFKDGGFGFIQKTDGFSVPISIKEINALQDINRNKGLEVFRQLEDFLCHVKNELPKDVGLQFECKGCSCTQNQEKTHTSAFSRIPKIIKNVY